MTKPHFFPALANREPPSTMADLLQVILDDPDIPDSASAQCGLLDPSLLCRA